MVQTNQSIDQRKLAARKKEMDEAHFEGMAIPETTIDRDSALDNMNDWMNDYFVIANITLEDKPKLLEKIGIAVIDLI